MYLFGYGSLINLLSAQKSFKRVLKQEDLLPVNINGFEKVWNSIENIQFDGLDVNGVFLNLQKNSNTSTNGVIIKITDEELELLKLREKNYTCITIKASNANIELDEDIIAFMTTKEDKIAKKGDENCFIPAKYIDILTNAFPSYNEEFKTKYSSCLENYPFEVKQGTYTFSDPVQNKFAKQGVDSVKSK
ncbi:MULTISPECIES: gamma-glutamylcyclotransferase [Arcobacteraceae]|uniref:Gamma-glutamylcyclotransferase n=1 Tax=Poseidonibacter parvus TaxID=1850254 RepID=A0A1P8KMU8_9BACT|nr:MULTISPECIES: gamma-glutamylcyclotransferase [Arcobacteraceae]APW65876.1 gamma-glutamylcyclotransferase [Poseidonibacter parvus]